MNEKEFFLPEIFGAEYTDKFKEDIFHLTKDNCFNITLNFSGVKAIDTPALGLLIIIKKYLEQKKGNLFYKNISLDIKEFMEELNIL